VLTHTTPDVRVVLDEWRKPWPNIDLDSKPFWDALKEHRFVLFRCKTCGAWYWPVAYCRNHDNEPFMRNLEWHEASGRGTVFAFNIHHWAFHPGFKDEVPYIYALIETEEGPMISSTLVDIDPSAVKVGMPVEIVYEDHPNEGFTIPKFKTVTSR
jgi:uncharacterized OB-fold protein